MEQQQPADPATRPQQFSLRAIFAVLLFVSLLLAALTQASTVFLLVFFLVVFGAGIARRRWDQVASAVTGVLVFMSGMMVYWAQSEPTSETVIKLGSAAAMFYAAAFSSLFAGSLWFLIDWGTSPRTSSRIAGATSITLFASVVAMFLALIYTLGDSGGHH